MSAAEAVLRPLPGTQEIVVWRKERDNILWPEKILQKDGKNTKKGVDKGRGVWYSSKAFGRRAADSGQEKIICLTAKKPLDKPAGVW